LRKFFVKKAEGQTSQDQQQHDDVSKDSAESAEMMQGNFMPFQVRERMKLAPCVRYEMSNNEIDFLDQNINSMKTVDHLYLKELKNGTRVPKRSFKTWPEQDNDDLTIVGELIVL
jgi:hypothetical protein